MFKKMFGGLVAVSLPVVSMAAPLAIDIADATGTVSNGATAAFALAVAVLALTVGVRIYKRISSAA
jgi:hypothetical protein